MTPKKTLFVSDLDGTLLSSEQTLSDFTTKTVNALTEKGMIFSYATARSYATAAPLTRAITSNIPVIVFNGTFIEESTGQRGNCTEIHDTGNAEVQVAAFFGDDLTDSAEHDDGTEDNCLLE